MFKHAIDKEYGDRRGVTIMIKRKILKNGEEDIGHIKEEIDDKEGDPPMKIKNLLDKELVICGIYADTNARAREKMDENQQSTINI